MQDDLISIIIPVYNAESYIDQCMEYIRNQTYDNMEIILVDDGSEDKSAQLCRKYEKKDARVRFFCKENGGPASARNVGIEKACGKYIYFMDVDDSIEKKAIAYLHAIYQEKSVDMVIGNAAHVNIFGKKGVIGIEKDRYFQNKDDVIKLLSEFADDIKSHKILWTVWGKLYRTDIIKAGGVIYNEKVLAWEDTLFVMSYLLHCKNVYYTGECLYVCDHYRKGDDGKQADCASGKMWRGALDFRYVVRKVSKALKGKKYRRVIGNCYSEYAILSMFTSVRLLKVKSFCDLRKLYSNVYRIVHDKTLQSFISCYVQKHDDNARVIPFLIKIKWVWMIIIVFKLQLKKIEAKNRGERL